MANASQCFFKAAGLDRWGHRRGEVPPSPLPMNAIRLLGDELDAAETCYRACWRGDTGTFSFTPDTVPSEVYTAAVDRFNAAKMAFGLALGERRRYLTWNYRNRRSPIRQTDVDKLAEKVERTEARFDLLASFSWEFVSAREFTFANYEFTLADFIHDSAEVMLADQRHDRRRQNRSDKAAGVVRRVYFRRR